VKSEHEIGNTFAAQCRSPHHCAIKKGTAQNRGVGFPPVSQCGGGMHFRECLLVAIAAATVVGVG